MESSGKTAAFPSTPSVRHFNDMRAKGLNSQLTIIINCFHLRHVVAFRGPSAVTGHQSNASVFHINFFVQWIFHSPIDLFVRRSDFSWFNFCYCGHCSFITFVFFFFVELLPFVFSIIIVYFIDEIGRKGVGGTIWQQFMNSNEASQGKFIAVCLCVWRKDNRCGAL